MSAPTVDVVGVVDAALTEAVVLLEGLPATLAQAVEWLEELDRQGLLTVVATAHPSVTTASSVAGVARGMESASWAVREAAVCITEARAHTTRLVGGRR